MGGVGSGRKKPNSESPATDPKPVVDNIKDIFKRRNAALYALCLRWAAVALNKFRKEQPATPGAPGRFWTNQTGQAAARMMTEAIKYDDGASIIMYHAVDYGIYLELANDRRYAAIMKIMIEILQPFKNEVDKLYAD